MDKYRAEKPRYLWYCGTKKYRKSDGTGTVEKWYRGAAVVPWYRATLHDRARREAARRRKSEREVNLAIRNSSRSNDSWQITPTLYRFLS